MALITWKNDYSVNIAIIDQQHKKLVELINELHDAMLNKQTKETTGIIIDELIKYTDSHFSTEEKYFEQFNYPDTVNHKRVHNNFVNKVVSFKKDFENGKVLISMEIINYLKEWLLKHILVTDKKYTNFLNNHGIK